jgi:hypothetical protein
MLDNLLQRSISRLDIELPHNEEFKQYPDAVEDVIFPLEMIEGDGIDVLIKEKGEIDCEPEDGGTLFRISFVKMKEGERRTLARMLYGRISTAYPTSNPDQAEL